MARMLAVLAIVAALIGAGWTVNSWRTTARLAVEQRDQQAQARRIEAQRNEKQQRINDELQRQTRLVGARLADVLAGLRNRPERLPEPAREACQGASGAELSGPDAAFLVRLAARADQLRADLTACQDGE